MTSSASDRGVFQFQCDRNPPSNANTRSGPFFTYISHCVAYYYTRQPISCQCIAEVVKDPRQHNTQVATIILEVRLRYGGRVIVPPSIILSFVPSLNTTDILTIAMTIQIKQKCESTESPFSFQTMTCRRIVLGWWRQRKRRELVPSAPDPILADGVQPTRYNKRSLHTLAAPPKPSNDTHQVCFIHILSEASLYDAVFDECSPMSLIRLSQTCVIANRAVNHYIAHAFDVNHLLSRYFADTLSFRHLQASTATIIGGSTALKFFTCTFWEDTCLDLFVPSVWAGEVGEFLLRSGYSFAPTPLQHPTFDTALSHSEVAEASVTSVPSFKGIVGSFDFTKSTPDCEGVKVRMMVVVRSPVEVILRSHSSTFSSLDLWWFRLYR